MDGARAWRHAPVDFARPIEGNDARHSRSHALAGGTPLAVHREMPARRFDPPDAFEISEMTDGTPVLHRDRRVSHDLAAVVACPGILAALMATNLLYDAKSSTQLPHLAIAMAVSGLSLVAFFFAGLALTLAVLRTVVTQSAVHVRYGLWGPSIPLADIVACNVVRYRVRDFAGVGYREGPNDARAYVLTSGLVLSLVYREAGKRRCVLVGAQDPNATLEHIERARTAIQAAVATGLH